MSDPDSYESTLHAQRERLIAEHGHMVMFIFPTQESIRLGAGHQFWYSVGRARVNKPDFLITGPLGQKVGLWMVNRAADLYDDGVLGLGEMPAGTMLEDFPVRVIEADPRSGEMNGALGDAVEHGKQVTAWQIVWPDKEGRFPGDPDFADGAYEQPLFPVSGVNGENRP